MNQTRRTTIVSAAATLAALPVAHAQSPQVRTRLLVIGNGAFHDYSALPNPARDARLIFDTFNYLGYQSTIILDVDRPYLLQNYRQFLRGVNASERTRVVIYVASHGIQIDGESFLLPVDASGWTSLADAKRGGWRVSDMLNQLADSGAASFVVFIDACRNNPFASTTGADAGLDRLAASNFASVREGVALSYSTQPGQVALDGPPGANSLYASALSTILRERPRATIAEVFSELDTRVSVATEGVQKPWSDCTLATTVSLIS